MGAHWEAFFSVFFIKENIILCQITLIEAGVWSVLCVFKVTNLYFMLYASQETTNRTMFTLKKNLRKDVRWNKTMFLSERDERRWRVLVSVWFRVWTEPLWVLLIRENEHHTEEQEEGEEEEEAAAGSLFHPRGKLNWGGFFHSVLSGPVI